MSEEKIIRAKIRITQRDLDRIRKFQKVEGLQRDRAYGEAIHEGLDAKDIEVED